MQADELLERQWAQKVNPRWRVQRRLEIAAACDVVAGAPARRLGAGWSA